MSIPAALSVNEGESVMVCATMSGFRGMTQRAVNVMIVTATGTGIIVLIVICSKY